MVPKSCGVTANTIPPLHFKHKHALSLPRRISFSRPMSSFALRPDKTWARMFFSYFKYIFCVWRNKYWAPTVERPTHTKGAIMPLALYFKVDLLDLKSFAEELVYFNYFSKCFLGKYKALWISILTRSSTTYSFSSQGYRKPTFKEFTSNWLDITIRSTFVIIWKI